MSTRTNRSAQLPKSAGASIRSDNEPTCSRTSTSTSIAILAFDSLTMSIPPEPDDIVGDLGGLTINDVPAWADMNIMPHGDPRTQSGSFIYVVWKGRKTGLFYSWYAHFHHILYEHLNAFCRNDVCASIEGYSKPRQKKYGNLHNARIAYWATLDAENAPLDAPNAPDPMAARTRAANTPRTSSSTQVVARRSTAAQECNPPSSAQPIPTSRSSTQAPNPTSHDTSTMPADRIRSIHSDSDGRTGQQPAQAADVPLVHIFSCCFSLSPTVS